MTIIKILVGGIFLFFISYIGFMQHYQAHRIKILEESVLDIIEWYKR